MASTVKPIGIVVTAQDRIRPFAALAQTLIGRRSYIQIYASGPAKAALEKQGIPDIIPFSADKKDFEQMVQRCVDCSIVITGVTSPFTKGIQKELQKCPSVTGIAYYDRFQPIEELAEKERSNAQETCQAARRILFVNANLATEPKHRPIGYSTLFSQTSKIIDSKHKAAQKLERLLKKLDIDPQGKRVFTYCGSTGDEYCTQAFPHFLQLLEKIELSNTLFLFWFDPKAVDLDLNRLIFQPHHKHLIVLPKDWSDYEAVAAISDGALLTFDAAITPASLLAGYPTIQVAPSSDAPDFGLKNRHFPIASTSEDFEKFISAPFNLSENAKLALHKEWGIRIDWADRLLTALGKEPKNLKRKSETP